MDDLDYQPLVSSYWGRAGAEASAPSWTHGLDEQHFHDFEPRTRDEAIYVLGAQRKEPSVSRAGTEADTSSALARLVARIKAWWRR